jgi:hypothetical protein
VVRAFLTARSETLATDDEQMRSIAVLLFDEGGLMAACCLSTKAALRETGSRTHQTPAVRP